MSGCGPDAATACAEVDPVRDSVLDPALVPVLVAVRRRIARAWLNDRDAGASGGARDGVRIGAVVLEAHQVAAVGRLRRAIVESGGALLADGVGTGKTYIALAVAAEAERVLVVGPAVLREMWVEAMERCGVRGRWVSFEGLSRGERGDGNVDLVIVDEAHHVRTPTTRRFRRLAELCVGARVLLLSATPVHNRAEDVRVLVSLWRGDAAFGLSEAELARGIVRRSGERVRASLLARGVGLPESGEPVLVPIADDAGVLDALLAMPSCLPPADGGGAEWLVTFGLVRQWASSDAALRAAVKRRLAQCVAMEAALARGRYPARRELRGWAYAEGFVQLAFPELVVASVVEQSGGVEELLVAVRGHMAGLRRVVAALECRGSLDAERAERLMEIVGRHPGERVVAFAGYGATVEELFRRLKGRLPAAVLDGRGGRVASGAMERAEVLRRFAPAANGGGRGDAALRIELLLTTDLLSEGVNLQDASVVVHLDLPWTPARLAQRVGRVARVGSAVRRVSAYVLSPPASAERWVELERRVRAKAGAAAAAIGAVGPILPGLGGSGQPSAVEEWEAVRELLEGWVGSGAPEGVADAECLVARVRGAGADGFLALVGIDRRVELVASAGATGGADATDAAGADRASAEPGNVLAAVRTVDRAGAWDEGAWDDGGCADATGEIGRALAEVRAAVDRWHRGERTAIEVGLRSAATALVRRRVLERIATCLRGTARHRRAVVGGLASAARAAAAADYGAGAERMLTALLAAPLEDEAWLVAVGAFGALHARPVASGADGIGDRIGDRSRERRRDGGPARLLAAVIFSA